MDRDDAALIEEALKESERIDAAYIRVRPDGDRVVLEGSVASPEEAEAAVLVAERHAEVVVNHLEVDPGLREGREEVAEVEPAVPAENEILIGDVDPLAGPESKVTTDIDEAVAESEPWDPPEEPLLPATADEYQSRVTYGDDVNVDPSPDPADPTERAAADLTQEDLERGARGGPVPSLSPDVAAGDEDAPQPDPIGRDSFGAPPAEETDEWPERVPGASPGTGAVGEGTAAGGGLSGEPATETGAAGADTASADPARSMTGTTAGGTGTRRGPQAREDPPLREGHPSAEPGDEPEG